MKGSQIFVVYANAAGTNVTLSTRLGSGHDEPAEEPASEAYLLAGSGIEGGKMTANILCKRCSSWKGGSMNLTGPAQQWIWASKTGHPIKSDSKSASIQQHDDGSFDSFRLDLNTISTSNTTNPFLDLATSSIVDAGAASSGYDGVGIPLHGIAMCLAFIVGFPFGAFLIRLASFRGLVWIHAGVQLLSYLLAIIGFGLGVYIAKQGAADVGFIFSKFKQRSASWLTDSAPPARRLPSRLRHRDCSPPDLPAHPGLRSPPAIQAPPSPQPLHPHARLVGPRSRHCWTH